MKWLEKGIRRGEDMEERNETLEHSFKGTEWAKHKYIRKENGKYIYPPDAEGEGKDSTAGMKKSLKSRIVNVWNEIKPSTVGQKIRNSIERSKAKKSGEYALPSRRQQKKMLKAARKDIKKTIKFNYGNSFGARLGGTLNKIARTFRNLPDVLDQKIRSSNQRAKEKAKLPTAKQREETLKNARKDIKKYYNSESLIKKRNLKTSYDKYPSTVKSKTEKAKSSRKNTDRINYRNTGLNRDEFIRKQKLDKEYSDYAKTIKKRTTNASKSNRNQARKKYRETGLGKREATASWLSNILDATRRANDDIYDLEFSNPKPSNYYNRYYTPKKKKR